MPIYTFGVCAHARNADVELAQKEASVEGGRPHKLPRAQTFNLVHATPTTQIGGK